MVQRGPHARELRLGSLGKDDQHWYPVFRLWVNSSRAWTFPSRVWMWSPRLNAWRQCRACAGKGRVGGSHSAIVVAKWSTAGPQKLGLSQLTGSPRPQSLPQYYLHSEQDEFVDSRAPLFQLLWAGRYSSLFNSGNPLLLDLCCDSTTCVLFPCCALGIVDRWNFKCVNCFEQVATARSPLPEQFATICNVRNPLLLYLCYNLTTFVLFPHCNYGFAIRCAPQSISSSSNYFEQVATARGGLWRFVYNEPVVVRFMLQFDYLCLSSHCTRGDADLKLIVYSCDVGTVRWSWIMTSR